MSLVTVSISAAVMCFAHQCFPVLVGKDTPIVENAPLVHRFVATPGYGGDVLQFARARNGDVFAVHRVYTGNPAQRRPQRLASPVVADRQGITGGCINAAPTVYDALVNSDATHITTQP